MYYPSDKVFGKSKTDHDNVPSVVTAYRITMLKVDKLQIGLPCI